MTFLLNIFQAYITIIFGVTVVNEDRQAGKTKVGVQIVVKRWQEKAAAHPSFLRVNSHGRLYIIDILYN